MLKRLTSIFIALTLSLSLQAAAQVLSFRLCIENPQVVGNQLIFDIHMTNTSSVNSIYLGSSDFFISYNQNVFCGRTATEAYLDASLQSLGYQIASPDVGGLGDGLLGFALFVPQDVSGDIHGKVMQIGPRENIRICQVVVQTVCNRDLALNLDWNQRGVFSTIVHSFEESPPWREVLVDGAAVFCVNDNPGPGGDTGDGPSVTIDVFPNPVEGQEFNVIIQDRPYETYTFIVYDMTGKPIQTYRNMQLTGEGKLADFVQLPVDVSAGTYILSVIDNLNNRVGSATFTVLR